MILAERTKIASLTNLRTLAHRTMVWAVDLDDGTLIDALGENLGRHKKLELPDMGHLVPCFGAGGWPDFNFSAPLF